jgi:hypothetical protein
MAVDRSEQVANVGCGFALLVVLIAAALAVTIRLIRWGLSA